MISADNGYYSERAAQDRYLGDVNWDIERHLDEDEPDPEGWYDGNPPDDYWDDDDGMD